MHLIDLSQPIYDAVPNCPGHPPVRSDVRADHPETGWRLELLTLAAHTGSHLDAPFHKLAQGVTIDQVPLDSFVGEALLADLRGIEPKGSITAALLASKLPKDITGKIVLLATGWGEKRGHNETWLREAPNLMPDAAEWLVAKGAKAVCIDHWGISGSDGDNDPIVHTILLSQNVWIGEDFHFPEEVYSLSMPQTLMALPINLKGHSGAWCRPVLLIED